MIIARESSHKKKTNGVLGLKVTSICILCVTIYTHWWVQYQLSENVYVQVKIKDDSNKNRISRKESILHEIPYFYSRLYVITIF